MSTTPILTRLVAASTLLAAGTASAAFVVEPNGLAAGNFSAENGTSNSTTAGSGTLLAPGLTSGAASVFGGEPYTYTYTPTVDADNITSWSSGTILNGAGGLNASGLTGGAAGIYNVYHVFPLTDNATGQPALYEITVNGSTTGASLLIPSQDQNVNDTNSATSGVGIGLWERIGQATVLDPSQPITLTITPGSAPTFTGIRTAGVLFEYAGPVPEPGTYALLGLGLASLGLRRRRS